MTTTTSTTAAVTSAPLLQARGVVKRFGKFVALHGIDLDIMPRTVHSVIGPNGAGKTTLFHTLTGTLSTSEGSIVFDDHDVTSLADHQRVQRGIARSFQVTSLFANLSVRENLRLAAQGVHQLQHLSLDRDVQRGRRLVGDKQPGPARERDCDEHPLAQPA